jgi:hypothetical protein
MDSPVPTDPAIVIPIAVEVVPERLELPSPVGSWAPAGHCPLAIWAQIMGRTRQIKQASSALADLILASLLRKVG